jgi:hypothetical protein
VSLTSKLEILEEILIHCNSSLLAHFNPGLPRMEVEQFFKENGIPINSQVIELYQWHNGVKTIYGLFDSEVSLFPFGKFFNLTEMMHLKGVFDEWAEDDFEDTSPYYPIFGSGESDMYVLDMRTGTILIYMPMIQENGSPYLNSIEELIDCLTSGFREGAISYGQQGTDYDVMKFNEVRERITGIAWG